MQYVQNPETHMRYSEINRLRKQFSGEPGGTTQHTSYQQKGPSLKFLESPSLCEYSTPADRYRCIFAPATSH